MRDCVDIWTMGGCVDRTIKGFVAAVGLFQPKQLFNVVDGINL